MCIVYRSLGGGGIVRMEISNYGVTLRKLTEDKIELVREWRNSSRVKDRMFFQNKITPEMQKKWFSSVDNENNYYFIIEYNGQDKGLINIKDIDYDNKTGEGGVLTSKEFVGDLVYRAHLVLFDFAFLELKLKTITAKIKIDNTSAIRLSEFLGSKKEIVDNQVMMNLEKENYLNNKNRLRFLKKRNKNDQY